MAEFNFLLLSDTFEQKNYSKDEVCESILQLFLLKEHINSFNEKTYRDDNIYNIEIINKKKIYEVLYDTTLDGDIKLMLTSIVDRSKEIIPEISINKYIGLHYSIEHKDNSIFLVDDWFKFHHDILVQDFTCESDFYLDIVKYFPNIVFQEDIKKKLKSLDGGCENFIQDIVSSLQCLDKNLHQDILETNNNLTETLKKISTKLSLDVTLEGDASRKKDLSFIFKDKNNKKVSVYCEPHIKLANSSNSSDSKWYANRIYFHQGQKEINDGSILIGYIGKHL